MESITDFAQGNPLKNQIKYTSPWI
jgi:hypothetical protein